MGVGTGVRIIPLHTHINPNNWTHVKDSEKHFSKKQRRLSTEMKRLGLIRDCAKLITAV